MAPVQPKQGFFQCRIDHRFVLLPVTLEFPFRLACPCACSRAVAVRSLHLRQRPIAETFNNRRIKKAT